LVPLRHESGTNHTEQNTENDPNSEDDRLRLALFRLGPHHDVLMGGELVVFVVVDRFSFFDRWRSLDVDVFDHGDLVVVSVVRFDVNDLRFFFVCRSGGRHQDHPDEGGQRSRGGRPRSGNNPPGCWDLDRGSAQFCRLFYVGGAADDAEVEIVGAAPIPVEALLVAVARDRPLARLGVVQVAPVLAGLDGDWRLGARRLRPAKTRVTANQITRQTHVVLCSTSSSGLQFLMIRTSSIAMSLT
jgi:hypothetical protein